MVVGTRYVLIYRAGVLVKTLRIFILILIACAGLAGCARYTIEAPDGFAEVKRRGGGSFLAVSPEGVQFGIKTKKNYPKQELEYWQTAMREHMLQAGYKLISGPDNVETENKRGVYFEWSAPYRGKDYLYMTGLVVTARKLLVIEAVGEAEEFLGRKESIIKSLTNMKIR